MKVLFRRQKAITIFMLLTFLVNTFLPTVSYALTSGPAQPEVQSFKPAGVSDMVNLESGDFKYNIPLLDIDGYPINLSYQSGTGIDDEASWVGLGWSLNAGAITRQVRGLPDDFNGTDMLNIQHYTKPKITVGGRVNIKAELFGLNWLTGSLTTGLFSDNYTGIGAEVGGNVGITLSSILDTKSTVSLGLGMTAGLSSNTQSGVDQDYSFSPSLSFNVINNWNEHLTVSAGLTGSLGYNSRSGLKAFAMGSSFGVSADYLKVKSMTFDEDLNVTSVTMQNGKGNGNYNMFSSVISYNTEPVSPKIEIPYTTNYQSYSFNYGTELIGVFPSIGGTGYKSVSQVKQTSITRPAYGFLYAERGKNDPNAVMDLIRENDNVLIPETPNVAIPIHTPDLWSYSSQAGSGQFRLYRGGSGIFFDNQVSNTSSNNSTGIDIGIGNFFHGGITQFDQSGTSTSRKWTDDNDYIAASGDFQDAVNTDPSSQHAYFRQVGEKNIENKSVNNALLGDAPLRVNLNGMHATSTFSVGGSSPVSSSAVPKLNNLLVKKRPTHTDISYLTASEATLAGLDKQIKVYGFNNFGSFTPTSDNPFTSFNRVDNTRKGHHISEINVTGSDGKRMVYGIPVYNTKHEEYSFAVSPKSGSVTDAASSGADIIGDPQNNDNGLDNYFHAETKPAYATSYLLTAILSPDYVDKTGDGISPDDLGTAIKFNYARINNFRWRAPFGFEKATFNKGLLADPDDNKGSVVYGEKELWYVSTIETKTKIVYFITENRDDAFGVASGWKTGGIDLSQPQKRLREIRLYSKANLNKPVKVIKFNYDYHLCPHTPNSNDNIYGGGKLSLTSISFAYGNSSKGDNHPYRFHYADDAARVGYDYMSTDRWGTYKPNSGNPGGLTNNEFPYTNQTANDALSSAWNLSEIDLPTGGTINVKYETKDYAYVQDKKAMVMTPIAGLAIANGTVPPTPTASLGAANAIQVNIGENVPTGADPTQWFKNSYLNGSDYMYTRTWVKMATSNSSPRGDDNAYDFIPCYAKVVGVGVTSNLATIQLEGISAGGVSNANPISIAAWQKIRLDYPRYAYPGFNNRIQSQNMPLTAAVGAILNALGNLAELMEPFNKKALNHHFADAVCVPKSFVKLVKRDGKKLGGGVRVKQITITDNWDNTDSKIDGVNGQPLETHQYGQAYDYTMLGDDGTTMVSTGVASYEPSVGNDENPLKEPVPYTQNIKGAINNYYSIEKPFCESLYPAPSITYSKVTVHDLGADHNPSSKTGYIVNEFYTAKDFPVKVTVTDLQPGSYKPSNTYSLTQTNSIDEKALSQGYCIELNDMAGKTKATRVFNQSGSEVSSSEYQYRTRTDDPTRLDNYVTTVNPLNAVSQNYMGRDIDFFTDFREDENSNVGRTINIGGDVFPFPLPWGFLAIPHKPYGVNNEYKLFRTAATLKVIQLYGIVSKVIKTQNGSSISSEDLAYDVNTGAPVVSRTQNEFNNYIYSVNIPAYWAHKNMGGAYQTSGTVIKDLKTDLGGKILSGTYYNALAEGDELINVTDVNGPRYWVVFSSPTYPQGPDTSTNNNSLLIPKNKHTNLQQQPLLAYADMPDYEKGHPKGGPSNEFQTVPTPPVTPPTPAQCASNYGSYPYKYLITRDGSIVAGLNNGVTTGQTVKIVRSGYRNMLDADVSSITCLNNPIVGDHLLLNVDDANQTSLKVINSSAASYSGVWAMPIHYPAAAATQSDGFNTLTTAFKAPTLHAAQGVIAYAAPNATTFDKYSNTGLQQRFDIAAVWPGTSPFTSNNNPNNMPLDVPVGFETDFVVPSSGTYVIGYSGDDNFLYTVDGSVMPSTSYGGYIPNYYWFLCSMSLTAGTHHIRAQVTNNSFPPGSPYSNATNQGDICIEVYQNTLADLKSGTAPTITFTSAQLKQDPTVQTFRMDVINGQSVQSNRYRYHINPFVDGYYGNWRPYQTMVLQQARTYKSGIFDAATNGVDVKNAGIINQFTNYWRYDRFNGIWVPNNDQNTWVIANTVSLYDKYGQQLENKDALGRYSAAKFDFNGELPSAVASNAKNNEIFACSFEDVGFSTGTDATAQKEPQFLNGTNQPTLSATMSHSGNYSAVLPTSGLTLSTNFNNAINYVNGVIDNNSLLLTNDHAEFNTVNNSSIFFPLGFSPNPGKAYVFDVWVNDGTPADKSVNVNLSVNGTSASSQVCRAVVEGWKLIEGTFTTPVGIANVQIKLTPTNGKSVTVDDIRIFPYDSHIKTYVYDNKNLRLMAELDENCFATFYEYDDEGLLVRVKKETEKGVMTLRESRSSYKKQPLP